MSPDTPQPQDDLVERMAVASVEAIKDHNPIYVPWDEWTEQQRDTIRRGMGAALAVARPHVVADVQRQIADALNREGKRLYGEDGNGSWWYETASLFVRSFVTRPTDD